MSEYIGWVDDDWNVILDHNQPIVRCRDCVHLDSPDWDNQLAECYGEPPCFCMRLSGNEWRMDGDRRVAETTFLEVGPNDFCAWGERRDE